MKTRIITRVILSTLLAAAWAYGAATYSDQCSTDSECLEQCPPPNDAPECDGGPTS